MSEEKAPIVKTNVSKVVIVPYTDKSYRTQDTKQGQFAIPINPESYSENYKVEYDLRRGQGQQGTNPKFKSTAPEELRLEFIFDGTETVEGYAYHSAKANGEEKLIKPVHEQIIQFRNTVYAMNGDIHRPRFLKIFWGELKFPCILTNLDINYTLFDTDGKPLRAKISATFVNYVAQEERVARENKRSPDLTKIRDFKEGDRLDLMTYREYDDSKYVLQIAKANGLSSFRNVKTGLRLNFPPFDKTEA